MSGGHPRGLHADPAVLAEARKRLRTVQGHVAGLMRMLEDERTYCVDALKQLKAVRGALDRISEIVLRGHLEHHVATAQARGDTREIVEELMDVLKYR